LNTGVPTGFPRLNGYVLIPNETGATVAHITWIGIERSPYPKRSGFKDWVFWKSSGRFWGSSDGREHAGENLEAEIFLVLQAVCASLKDADLVVEALDETE
jgi:hypothetical protein